MSWHARFRNVFRAERLNTELDHELEFHLAETVDALIAKGMSEKDALRQARLRLGNYYVQKERTRDMDIAGWLDEVRADIFYGLRQFKLNPGFVCIAVLSLALGIGANSSIFQLVNAIRLKTLPVQHPEELTVIDFSKNSVRSGSWSSRSGIFSYSQWEQLRAQQQAFTEMLAWSAARFNLTHGGEFRFADGLYVSGDFFRDLGVGAIVGRTFTAQDDSPNCTAGAVISNSFWQREYAGDRGILGRTVSLDGHSFPVIGVTPASFFGVEVGNRFDIAIPICADQLMADDGKGRMASKSAWWLSMMGRLKPGWTVERANAHLHALSGGIMRVTIPVEYKPDFAKRFLANKIDAKEGGTGVSGLRSDYERPLWLLMAITGLVLLIACANVANLLMARATVREAEIAVRLAIGASRGRLVRQLLAESLLLATAGAVLGAGLALLLTKALIAFISTPDDPAFVDIASDWRVLGFTIALALLTCILFGLLPALRGTHLSPVSAMRSGSRSVTAGRERFGIRRALVATQVALSLVLLVGALLFIRSLHNLMTTDPGFVSDGVLAINLDISKAATTADRKVAMYRELSGRLAGLTGTISFAQAGSAPVGGSSWNNFIGPDRQPAEGSKKLAWFNRTGPGYFRTMSTRVLAGREFNDRDALASPKVAIVNEMFGRMFFGGANPVGHTFHMQAGAGEQEKQYQIVGLVANTKYSELREDFKPIAFLPILQDDQPQPGTTFLLRIAGPLGPLMKNAKAAITEINPAILIDFRPLSKQLENSLMREKLMATLSGGFGILAVLLATIGLYGVIAYMVAKRRNEIGLRIALGANRGSVIRLVLREAVLLVGVGLVVGCGLALWAGKAASSLLFGLESHDVVSLAGACALLTAIALLASYLPARRAARVDPMTSLRSE